MNIARSAAIACILVAGCRIAGNDAPTSSPSNGKNPQASAICGSPTVFDGIDHCPLGSASLGTVSKGLAVTGITSSGNDGVTSSFADTNRWKESAATVTTLWEVTVEAVGVNSGAHPQLQAQRVATSAFTLMPTFTGVSNFNYSIAVYSNNVLQGSQASVAYNATPCGFTVASTADSIEMDNVTTHFHLAGNGALTITYENASMTSVVLPNSTTLYGDKIVFTETSTPGAARHFNSVDITGTMESMIIESEALAL